MFNVHDSLPSALASAVALQPKVVFTDNGREFIGRLLHLWAYHHPVRLDFSRPGRPTDNCFVESFNGSLRDEYLNVRWFATLDEARVIIEAWRIDYNESRPHMALNGVPAGEYARRHKELEFHSTGRAVQNQRRPWYAGREHITLAGA